MEQRKQRRPVEHEVHLAAAPWREPEPREQARPGALPLVRIGEVAGVDRAGRPLVFTTSGRPSAAEVVWMPCPPDWQRCTGLRVALGFVDGDPERPIVLGLLDAPPAREESLPAVRRLESAEELVIECGKSKIALRADGRIEIRGGHLISRSSGPNKIKGATVDIN